MLNEPSVFGPQKFYCSLMILDTTFDQVEKTCLLFQFNFKIIIKWPLLLVGGSSSSSGGYVKSKKYCNENYQGKRCLKKDKQKTHSL